ncbi:MAG: hypothetical protein H6837_02750 [Planctomycetes bacterium]|nr:hypothetical protein [Planctomycetota bacterium]
MRYSSIPSFVSFLVLCGAVAAQSTAYGGSLAGNLSPSGPAVSITGLAYRQDIASCGAAVRIGSTLSMPLTTQGGGGSAYDAARQGLWISDGRSITLKDIASGNESCRFTATLTGGTNNVVTGLAHNNRQRQLIQLEVFPTSSGNSMALRFYDTTQCPPKVLPTTCAIPLPTVSAPGTARGLAYDELRDLIFYSVSLTTSSGIVNSVSYVPMPIACIGQATSFGLPSLVPCGGADAAVSGLAYDACSKILFVTEGSAVLRMDLSNLAAPKNLNASTPCCKLNVPRQLWASLTYIPRSTVNSVGNSCAVLGCATCNAMALEVAGDLILGNPALELTLTAAPANATASLFMSIGRALVPGIPVPGLCGLVHTPIAGSMPILLGSFSTGGSGGCSGGLRLPAPVPVDPGLCDVYLTAQVWVQCSGGGGLTNALELRVGS